MRASPVTRWAEGIAAGLAIGLAGLLRPEDPAFAGLGFLPQALGAVLVASLLGVGPALAAMAGSAAAFLCLGPASGALGLGLSFYPRGFLAEAARLPAAAAIAAAVAAGWARNASELMRRKLMLRIRELSRAGVKRRKVNEALSAVNEELERRVAGQRDSISALYSHMRNMDSHDLGRVLGSLLDAVRAFSQAQEAAIYEYDQAAGKLALAAHIGPEPPSSIPLEGSAEGWVFRNGAVFSLRMLRERPLLAQLDLSRTVLAFPLKAGDLPWGMLNIREMPFYRFNPVTEKNLGILVELSAQSLKKAVEFRERESALPLGLAAGLPGREELLAALGEQLKRRAPRRLSVSLVVLELLGLSDLESEAEGARARELLDALPEAIGRRDSAYRFGKEGQLAFLLPGIDRDGASLFCLELIALMDSPEWSVEGRRLRLEPAFGIGSFPGTGAGMSALKPAAGLASEMADEAEAVLSLSRRGYAERSGVPR